MSRSRVHPCGMTYGALQRTLGINVRRIRKDRQLSQEEFAECLGVHRTYLGAIERGERNLSLKSVEALASTLKVAPLYLLSEDQIRN